MNTKGTNNIVCNENKYADQLPSDCETDRRLCFCICKMLVMTRLILLQKFICGFHSSLRKLAHAIYRKVFSAVKNENFVVKMDIFNILAQNIHCGYTLEPPLTSTHSLCGSNEYPQCMF